MSVRGIAVAAALSLLASTAGAGVYRWVDDAGNVHYGDRPPPGAEAVEEAEAPAAPAGSRGGGSAAERREKRQRLLRAWEEERRAEAKAEAEAERRAAKRRRNCHRARDRLRRYRSAGALYDLDENGERRILSDEERARAETAARAAVERWCE